MFGGSSPPPKKRSLDKTLLNTIPNTTIRNQRLTQADYTHLSTTRPAVAMLSQRRPEWGRRGTRQWLSQPDVWRGAAIPERNWSMTPLNEGTAAQRTRLHDITAAGLRAARVCRLATCDMIHSGPTRKPFITFMWHLLHCMHSFRQRINISH